MTEQQVPRRSPESRHPLPPIPTYIAPHVPEPSAWLFERMLRDAGFLGAPATALPEGNGTAAPLVVVFGQLDSALLAFLRHAATTPHPLLGVLLAVPDAPPAAGVSLAAAAALPGIAAPDLILWDGKTDIGATIARRIGEASLPRFAPPRQGGGAAPQGR